MVKTETDTKAWGRASAVSQACGFSIGFTEVELTNQNCKILKVLGTSDMETL